MAVEDQSPVTAAPVPTHGDKVAETGPSHLPVGPSPSNPNPSDTSPKKLSSARDFIVSVAANISSQPFQNFDPGVWGALTPICNNAPIRQQGINMLLTANEHSFGCVEEDGRFQINLRSVSAEHCIIYRTEGTDEKMGSTVSSIWLKDTSKNGTYLNWKRVKKNHTAVKVCHGDIISFAAPPEHEKACALVFREVIKSAFLQYNGAAKRKMGNEEFVSENKRLKRLRIGAPEGPISLDDFQSLQRSNTELRKQLEDRLVLIETLGNENRAAFEQHGSELKSVKESVEKSYLDQLKEFQQMVDLKQKELGEINRVSAEQNERLNAFMQLCTEANAIVSSQTVNIAELKKQLREEQSQRKEEREKAAADLKASVHRVQSEAQEELKRFSDVASRLGRELQESMKKLQVLDQFLPNKSVRNSVRKSQGPLVYSRRRHVNKDN